MKSNQKLLPMAEKCQNEIELKVNQNETESK